MYFSIIIPIYNAKKTLSRTINSIRKQSFEDFELILVNDGSNDGSLSICRQFAAIDNRIKVINTKNGGVSKARNLGLNIAKGDYICFIDADDTVREDWLKHYASNCEADILSCGRIILSENGEILNQYPNNCFYQDINAGINIMSKLGMLNPPWSKCYKAEIIRKYNLLFLENCHLFEDLIFSLQFLQKVQNIQLISYVGYEYRLFNSVLTRRFNDPYSLLEWSKRVIHEASKFMHTNKLLYKSIIEQQFNHLSIYLVDYFNRLEKNARHDYYIYLKALSKDLKWNQIKLKSVVFSFNSLPIVFIDALAFFWFCSYRALNFFISFIRYFR